jgi:hypothetical protein
VFGLFIRKTPYPIGPAGVNSSNSQVSVKRLVHFLQTPIPRSADDRGVKLGIIPVVRCAIFVRPNISAQGFQQFLEPAYVGIRESIDRVLSGETLQSASNLKGLVDVLCGETGDKRSTARTDLDEPLGCKLLDCAPNWSEAYAEFRGEIVDVQSLAWLKE